MTRLHVACTAQLPAQELTAARHLLADGFDDWSPHDWEHCLGGVHALLWEDDELVAHGALVPRRLWQGGQELRAGYVEGVVVRRDRRRRGHGARVMAALEQAAAEAHDVAALSTTEEGEQLYRSRGWLPWRGPLGVRTPTGTVATPDDDGSVLVLPLAAELDLDAPLSCDGRDGDVW